MSSIQPRHTSVLCLKDCGDGASDVVIGPYFIRKMLMPMKGTCIVGHKHFFHHLSEVKQGSVHITRKDGSGRLVIDADFKAGDSIWIVAHQVHEIVSLEDNTIFTCMFLHRRPDGSVSEEYTGWMTAYEGL